MTEHPLITFLRARYDEAEQTAWRQHTPLNDPAFARADISAKRQLLDQYERLMQAKDAHAAAVSELSADIEHEERTGVWSGAGQSDVRLRALHRENDYLTAMLPVIEGLVKAFAASYASHPDYPKDQP